MKTLLREALSKFVAAEVTRRTAPVFPQIPPPHVGGYARKGPLLGIPLLFLLAICGAQAHDPFDCSTRLLVEEDRLQITVTMGLDAARNFLSAAGLPPAEIADTVRTRGPHSSLDLSVDLAAQLIEAKIGDTKLDATRVTALSEGLEIYFNVFYPRPGPGTLELRAVFYERIADLRQGSFVAYDETMKPLVGVLFSRANFTAQVPLALFVPDSNASASASDETFIRSNETPTTQSPAGPIAPRPSFGQFLRLGIEHILTGFDHLLFLAALLVGVRKPVAMLGVITCFTLAHSVTLALSALDLVTISSRIIEPLIAVSIIVVCVENLLRKDATADRFWLAGGFGLIHGFGFAGALRETGLAGPGDSMVMPLFSFNLGVEAGQLAVAALLLPVLFCLRRWPGFARFGTPAISAVVIMISSYWLLERTIFFH